MFVSKLCTEWKVDNSCFLVSYEEGQPFRYFTVCCNAEVKLKNLKKSNFITVCTCTCIKWNRKLIGYFQLKQVTRKYVIGFFIKPSLKLIFGNTIWWDWGSDCWLPIKGCNEVCSLDVVWTWVLCYVFYLSRIVVYNFNVCKFPSSAWKKCAKVGTDFMQVIRSIYFCVQVYLLWC